MKLKIHHIGLIGTLLLLIGLAGLIPLNWLVDAVVVGSQGPAATSGKLEARPTLVTQAMKAAPLFEKSRKPFVAKVVAPPKPVERDPFIGWRLSGVMGTASGAMVAWLQKGSERPKKVKVGDEMLGWHVSNIEAGKVEFTKDEKNKILEQGK